MLTAWKKIYDTQVSCIIVVFLERFFPLLALRSSSFLADLLWLHCQGVFCVSRKEQDLSAKIKTNN